MHSLNEAVRDHGLLVSVIRDFATWGVLTFGVAVFALWLLDEPRRTALWRRATTHALAAAGLALVISQALTHVWDRPRPYQSNPDVLPLLSPSLDPSFPSDHAAAAFAIAVSVLLVHRRAGRLFLAWAALIAVSRVLAGMHYPTDILAGVAVGTASAFAVARLAGRPLAALTRLVGYVTDPILAAAREARVFSRTVGSPDVRRSIVLAAGAAALTVFAYHLRAHLIDEMPLAVLGAWLAVVLLAARIAGRSATLA